MTSRSEPYEIAIVSMAGLYPGAPDADAFGRNVLAGRQFVREVPGGRWILAPELVVCATAQADKAYSSRACFVDEFTLDCVGLDIDLDTLRRLDPVFQWVLHVGNQAWRKANTASLDRSRVGVALAAIALPTDSSSAITRELLGADFERKLFENCGLAGAPQPVLHTHPLNAFPVGLPAGLLAAGLGLGGGACTLDAACASSLYAIKIACDELAAGRTDAMLAGGVSRPEALYTQVGFSQLQALSRSGRCGPFDAGADGLVVGEGCGFVLLKRLDDAVACGDRILGVIRAIGVSNDMAGSLLAADQEGQLRAMRAAYTQAGWQPNEVDHIECHGTGTPLGDAVEFGSLCELWSDVASRPGQCAIGSVKSMIGHTLTAAGVAGLHKTLIGMQQGLIPPSANFRRESERVSLGASPFRVQTESQSWQRRSTDSPRRAAVSAFGFGGINAHLLLEEYVPHHRTSAGSTAPQAGVVSAGRQSSPPSVGVIGIHVLQGDDGGLDFPLHTFRIPPREIEQTLPQQLVMLDAVAGALRDCGVASLVKGPRVGVIIGINLDLNTSNYHLRWMMERWAPEWAERLGGDLGEAESIEWCERLREAAAPALNAPRVLGALGSIVASRIAREFGLGGPSFAISAMENSGLRALEYAVRAIQRGELDYAVVGAVDLCGDSRTVEVRAALGFADLARRNDAIALVLCRDELTEAAQQTHAKVVGLGCASGGNISSVHAGAGMASTTGPRGLARALAAREADDPNCTVRFLPGQRQTSAGGGAVDGLALLVRAARALQSAPATVDGETLRASVEQEALDGTAVAVVLEQSAHANQRLVGDMQSGHGRVPRSQTRSTVRVPLGISDFDPPPPPVRRPGKRTASFPAYAAAPVVRSAGRTAGFAVACPDLVASVARSGAQTAIAHQRFLHQSAQAIDDIARATGLLSRVAPWEVVQDVGGQSSVGVRPAKVGLTREECLEFARGLVARVFGPRFAEVDAYPVRVRLPDEPLMLVDRVLRIDGDVGALTSGCIVTEHDVLPGAWYLDCDRAPVCISVEAGQADLMLSGYLGIDLAVKGKRAYRLLDATVQFYRGLPRPGETIRYEIHIDKFVRQGDAYLFFFRFEGAIRGEPLISMTNGCAGFFTPTEIERSGGIILPAAEDPGIRDHGSGYRGGPRDCWFAPTSSLKSERYTEGQIDALRRGDLPACFGPAFDGLPLQNPVRIPGGRMRLVDRVRELDLSGGRFGLGRIIAEADIVPDAWFLTCHFVDDMVMPGTLMYECCAHVLRVLLTRMGWVGECSELAYEPVQRVPAKLKCRGPVTPATKQVTYQVDIKEIGFRPEPYVIADALMCADGRPIVTFTDMSMQLTGTSRERLEAIWESRGGNSGIGGNGAPAGKSVASHELIGSSPIPNSSQPPVFTKQQILAFSNGKPSDCFGPAYRVFDSERRIARLPGPPYQVLDRITRIEGPRANVLAAGGWIEAQYDVPRDAWYFAANRQTSMPFAILLEVALQPCGWLAAYVGSALSNPQDLRFRNLNGTATQHAEVFADAGMLTTRVRLTEISQAAGMILQKFDFQVWRQDGVLVYAGDTLFGFFTEDALRKQVGIRDKAGWARESGEAKESLLQNPPLSEGLALPDVDWSMIDGIARNEPNGGEYGLGLISGWKNVDPNEWFFAAHFYEDPVIPGSLGLESLLQLLKIAAVETWGANLGRMHRFEPIALGLEHQWRYRGQILPTNRRVLVQAQIKRREEGPSPLFIADGYLSVDGLCIYQMRDFGLRLVPREAGDIR